MNIYLIISKRYYCRIKTIPFRDLTHIMRNINHVSQNQMSTNEGINHQPYYKQFMARRSRQRDSENIKRNHSAPCRPHRR